MEAVVIEVDRREIVECLGYAGWSGSPGDVGVDARGAVIRFGDGGQVARFMFQLGGLCEWLDIAEVESLGVSSEVLAEMARVVEVCQVAGWWLVCFPGVTFTALGRCVTDAMTQEGV